MTPRRDLSVAVVVGFAIIVLVLLAVMALVPQTVRAADDPSSWPCRQAGWEVGTQWGPGPEDIVPDVPICPDDPEPVASDEPLTVDVQSEVYVGPGTTPPPTDTK